MSFKDRAAAVELDDVHKSFGPIMVLNGISLAVMPHEVVCFIGASGSGKSTLLKCVNLIEGIDSGRILVGGEEITARAVDVNRIRRRIGIVFQAFNLFPHMTVLRNITLGPVEALGQSRAEALEVAGACSSASGLPTRPTSIPTGFLGASSNASRSCARLQ